MEKERSKERKGDGSEGSLRGGNKFGDSEVGGGGGGGG